MPVVKPGFALAGKAGFLLAVPAPFFLVGPTAVGKTSLAVEIAARCGAEIVSADAFQVYAGLDLLTAKPTPEQRRRVPHHLVGTLPLTAEYSVARFLEQARVCLAAIAARGRPAVVAGGSGLYVKALTHGLSPLPPAQPERRAELERWELDRLRDHLRALDPAGPDQIDAKNKRRLIRAVEICEATGQPLAASRTTWPRTGPPSLENGLFLTRARSELNERIRSRVTAMASTGVLAEVGAEARTTFSSTSARIIGLADLQAHLRGEIGLASCLEAIEASTRRYAKRQLTWFRGQSGFTPLDLSTVGQEQVIDEALRRIQMRAPGA